MIQYGTVNGAVERKVSRKRPKSPREIAKEELLPEIEKLNTEQKAAFDLLVDTTTQSIFLTGGAGTGKSHVVKLAIQWLRRVEEKWVAVTSTTASSAKLIDAVTVHSFFRFKPEVLISEDGSPQSHAPSKVCKADILIVDEISMARCDLFMAICASIQKADAKRKKLGLAPIKLCVVGDMCQLPPVTSDQDRQQLTERLGYDIGEGFAFQTKAWEKRDFHIVELTEIIRQDNVDFIHALNQIRDGNTNYYNWFNHNCSLGENPAAISLFPYNSQVRQFNFKKLSELPGVMISYDAELYGTATQQTVEDMGFDFTLNLKKDCLVIIRSNPNIGADWCKVLGEDKENYNRCFCNGSVGVYRDTFIDETDGREYLMIELLENGKFLLLYRKDYPVYDYITVSGKLKKVRTENGFHAFSCAPAYALSYHRAQGASLPAVNLQPHGAFASGMLYVGLSRVTGGAEHIFLQDFVRPEDVILSDAVREFYQKIRSQTVSN